MSFLTMIEANPGRPLDRSSMSTSPIERESLREVLVEGIRAAHAGGRRLRLVTSVWREDDPKREGRVRGRVRAVELDLDHPLAAIGGESLGALLHTDLMGDVLVAEIRALVPQTAYGVYADLLHLVGRAD